MYYCSEVTSCLLRLPRTLRRDAVTAKRVKSGYSRNPGVECNISIQRNTESKIGEVLAPILKKQKGGWFELPTRDGLKIQAIEEQINRQREFLRAATAGAQRRGVQTANMHDVIMEDTP
eukprot:scaffold421358_cov61-Attheya_sp.AAC.3